MTSANLIFCTACKKVHYLEAEEFVSQISCQKYITFAEIVWQFTGAMVKTC